LVCTPSIAARVAEVVGVVVATMLAVGLPAADPSPSPLLQATSNRDRQAPATRGDHLRLTGGW
jgi:hypothetical protein